MPTMKFSGKNHTSILTRFFFVLLAFFLTSLINPSKSYAGGTYVCNQNDKKKCDITCTTGYHGDCTFDAFGICTYPLPPHDLPQLCVKDNVTIPKNKFLCSNGVCDTSQCDQGYEGKCTTGFQNKCTGPTTATACTKISGGVGGTGPNPVQNCTNNGDAGIETALGCIPYEYESFVPSLLGFLVGIIGAIALVVMLVGTVTIMTASGNPEAVKKGKELFTAAITGLLFIVFSVALLRIVAGDIIKLPGF
ncbi:MAG: pilin [bacterium]